MTKITFDISVSLDGYVAGPNPTLEEPLGRGGEQLHEWAYTLKAFQELHGRSGGEEGPDNDVMTEAFSAIGAAVLGRRMFSGGSGRWEDDPNADGWWGDEPPFGGPVFVLTHHDREPLRLGKTTFTFVTDGVESAVEQARAVAGGKNVSIGGGGSVIQQALAAGLVDEFQLHVVPILLGSGTRLFADDGPALELERTRVLESPRGVAHLSYRVER
jgi:dihydrofolate reductase